MHLATQSAPIEGFSFECRRVIGFAIATLHDWLKKLSPLFHPIRSETKTNRNSFALVFLRFASATRNYHEFWLVYCIVCVLCDWLEWLLWFWFCNTQLKTTLIRYDNITLFIHGVFISQLSYWIMRLNCVKRSPTRGYKPYNILNHQSKKLSLLARASKYSTSNNK